MSRASIMRISSTTHHDSNIHLALWDASGKITDLDFPGPGALAGMAGDGTMFCVARFRTQGVRQETA